MALNSHVFISYSHEDKEKRDSIISILQKAVGDCLWYDYAGLKPGQDFYTVIADKIEQCQYFVLLLSENSANSDWVSKELSYANDNKKCIVPVILEEVPKDHLPKKMRIIISDIHQIRWYELNEVDFYNIMKNAMNDIEYNANSGANESANESFLTANSDKYRCEFKPSEYDLVKSLLEKEKSGDTVTCMIPENAIILGRAYESGEGVDRNINTALKYYRIARSEDSKEAEFYEARCLLEETDSDTERKKYIDILQKLCDENVVLALNYLGDIYYDGKYVIEDPERAVELWKKSVELHDPEGQYSLAFCMAYGKGTEINQERAYELACISNEKKFPRAARLLGHFYSEGDYVEKDEDRAMTYYQEAAQRGDYFSLCFVGDIYYSRNDYTNAYTYYNEAAERGQPNGKSSLARLYANGLGVEKNIPKAVSLYSDAILHSLNSSFIKVNSSQLLTLLKSLDDDQKISICDSMLSKVTKDLSFIPLIAGDTYLKMNQQSLAVKRYNIGACNGSMDCIGRLIFYYAFAATLPECSDTSGKNRKKALYWLNEFFSNLELNDSFIYWQEQLSVFNYLYGMELDCSPESTREDHDNALIWLKKALDKDISFSYGVKHLALAYLGQLSSKQVVKDVEHGCEILALLSEYKIEGADELLNTYYASSSNNEDGIMKDDIKFTDSSNTGLESTITQKFNELFGEVEKSLDINMQNMTDAPILQKSQKSVKTKRIFMGSILLTLGLVLSVFLGLNYLEVLHMIDLTNSPFTFILYTAAGVSILLGIVIFRNCHEIT